ncbi:hypothetical protein CSUB01_10710 [Colletotrichum sublineola]|uniref:Uncharacterized protein n=1 Tax=Colletotrichum sublineola TaxID=1173701 RepID=A0A066X1W9_COLSU|nr:hypothetical protein CSUB01_10710 [Colletotrichum sublineola]
MSDSYRSNQGKTWQGRLEDACREATILPPVFQIVSDRRGGRRGDGTGLLEKIHIKLALYLKIFLGLLNEMHDAYLMGSRTGHPVGDVPSQLRRFHIHLQYETYRDRPSIFWNHLYHSPDASCARDVCDPVEFTEGWRSALRLADLASRVFVYVDEVFGSTGHLISFVQVASRATAPGLVQRAAAVRT